MSANHRANDVIVLEDKEQILTAKFSYGPLDFALSGEKVDIYISSASASSTSTSASTPTATVTSQGANQGAKTNAKSSTTSTTATMLSNGAEWRLLATAVTDSHGRLKYELPKERRLPLGMYHIKCVVKCDHTYVNIQLCFFFVRLDKI